MFVKMKRIFGVILLSVCISIMLPGYTAQASGIKGIKDFNALDGDGKYLGENYRDNYYLDIEETGLLDAGWEALNNIANVLLAILRIVAYLVVSVFYYAMSFDLGILFAGGINRIQESLNSGIFEPFFVLAFAGTSFIIISRMLKRDMVGIMTEFLKVVFIILISILVVKKSDLALSACTSITKSISIEALTGINDDKGIGTDLKNYAASAAGVLWANLIHEPWKSLEFGDADVSSSDVNKFLSIVVSDVDKRKDLVENFPDSETVFSKRRGTERIGFMLVYFIPFVLKCLIYLLVAVLQLLFQVLAVFYLILAPIILLMALLPGYDLNIIAIWLKKILETQLSILIITFVMGLLVKFDSILYGQVKALGWLIVMIFQTGISVGLFLFRNQLLKAFSGMHKGVVSPRYAMNRFKMSGDPYKTVDYMTKKIRQGSTHKSSTANHTSGNIQNVPAMQNSSSTRKTSEEQKKTKTAYRERHYRPGRSEPAVSGSKFSRSAADAAGSREGKNVIRPDAEHFRREKGPSLNGNKEVNNTNKAGQERYIQRPTLDSTRLEHGKAENVNVNQHVHESKNHVRPDIAAGVNKQAGRKTDSDKSGTQAYRTEKIYMDTELKGTGGRNDTAASAGRPGIPAAPGSAHPISLHDERPYVKERVTMVRNDTENVKVNKQKTGTISQDIKDKPKNVRVNTKNVKVNTKNKGTQHRNITASPEVLKKNYRNGSQ